MANNTLPTLKKTGKAVADIKGIFLLKHTNGEPTITDMLKSQDWFAPLTLRGSVSASQDAPSLTEIHVDQFDPPIGMTSEPGSFSFEAKLPSMLENDIKDFLGEYNASTNPSGVQVVQDTGANVTVDGRKLFGFNLDGTIYDMSVMIQTRSGQIIVFPHAQLTLTFGQDDKTFVFTLSGQIVAPENENNQMIYIAHDKSAE